MATCITYKVISVILVQPMPLPQVWTHSSFFTFLGLKISKFTNVNTFRVQLIFPSKPNFCNLFEIFSNKIHWKINIFHTLALKIVKLAQLNLTPRGLFNNTKNAPQIPIQFSVLILFNFHWIINSFHTLAPKSLKQVNAPLLIKSFPKIPRVQHEAMSFRWSQHDKQNKTNYLVS